MARSQETFSKKEKTKKRLQKRKEKEQRREEKRQEGTGRGKSLDDMLAYVDENGNLSSTPPDPKKVKKVALEDISIVTPREEDIEEETPVGVVSYFDPSKGYGFITDSRTQERIFVHVNNLSESLSVGDQVEYTAKKTPRGLQAETIRKR